ncbi:MAG: transcription/translation regulatory transformer protein RfaH [Coxiellaceae bacterium]|nr:transcription/translation regulatory transformer protein RfaH [Coxiellaceae bacterium]
MNSKQDNNWYLVFTKVRSEFKAKENLIRQGYTIYLPVVQKRKPRCRRGNIVPVEAFFPRYLFLQLGRMDNWRPISSTIGVSRIVSFGGVFALVPEDLIKFLKSNENQDGLQPNPSSKLTPGDKVMIINGPFTGQEGIYQRLKGSERVEILLDILGKDTQITLSTHDLQIE